jgi:hypothetical protein
MPTKLQFTMEHEYSNKINYLHTKVIRGESNIIYNIFMKSTITSTTKHNTSCHPHEHMRAAFRYLQNRVNTYPLAQDSINNGNNIIKKLHTKMVIKIL